MYRFFVLLLLIVGLGVVELRAQTTSASVTGFVRDPSNAVVPGAKVTVINLDTGVQYAATTNNAGIYTVPNLPPGRYKIEVEKAGFKTVIKPNIVLQIQQVAAINFGMAIGSMSESVTVSGGTPLLNTTNGTVSTVVDRQFVENMPMNGRTFQSLIELTPGVVPVKTWLGETGQFSINGQRSDSNYWTVDGVSGSIGTSTYVVSGTTLAGTTGGTGAWGGYNGLVSVDDVQEFRIQTSTYAPEFGRTPGGQISIVTRSGTNQFHGTAFDYLRNSVLDANDWFADRAGLPKPAERQNDFGGVLGGPVLIPHVYNGHNRTFFFFSYEGLRLRQPRVQETTVPDLNARKNAPAALQPYFNAYPLPNGPDNPSTGAAQLNASYSDPGTLNAYSLRIDSKLTNNLTAFARYAYSPSDLTTRMYVLSNVSSAPVKTVTATGGLTWALTPTATNDFRFNFSRVSGSFEWLLDNFGGAVPLTSAPFPSGYTLKNSALFFTIESLAGSQYGYGNEGNNLQRQWNLVDNFTIQKASHTLKFGVDYRRLLPVTSGAQYITGPFFSNVSSAVANSPLFSEVSSLLPAAFVFNNLGAYAQDTWKILPRLTATYGVRWDVDFTPTTSSGPDLPAVTGYNLTHPSSLALAPAGTPAFHTTYGNFAPRIGLAYQLSQRGDWQTVLRGGLGVFYDLADSEVGNMASSGYPFSNFSLIFGGSWPLTAAQAAPPPITPAGLASGRLSAFNPNLDLPYSLEWNFSAEQELGRAQRLSVSYIGSAGRRLLQSAQISPVNASILTAYLVGNTATSNYSALQIQLQRRVSRGLDALASYTWAHSIDTASSANGNVYVGPNGYVPGSPNANRGPSDFDIRQAFSAAVSYDIPSPTRNLFLGALTNGWSLENDIQVHTAPPLTAYYQTLQALNGAATQIRPDIVPGQPLYLYGPQFPGGKAFNPAAFTKPPIDPSTHLPTRQGDLGRNALRGFGLGEWDFAVHRDFPIHESLDLQFRAEMFNVLNHPNFGSPNANLNSPLFGRATAMLNESLGGGVGNAGGLNPLYQIGGPRSIQLALKLMF